MAIDQGAALLNLQEIDLELFRLKAELENLPERLKLSQLKLQYKEIHKKTLALLTRKKDLEIELETLEDERKACLVQQDKLNSDSGSNHRKLKLVERELSGLAKRMEKLEFTSSNILVELTQLEKLQVKSEQAQESLKTQIAALEVLLKRKAQEVYERVQELGEERETEMSQIQEDYLELYHKLAATKAGIAVSRLSVEKCSVCGSHFQEGALSRLKRGPAISECPSCHRMIVVRYEDAFDREADHVEA